MRNTFCLHLAVVLVKICEVGYQTGAPAKGFAKSSIYNPATQLFSSNNQPGLYAL